MRVVLLSSGMPTQIGDLSNALCEHVELLLITPENNLGSMSEDYLSPTIKHFFYYQHRQRSPQNIFTISKILNVIKSFKPDVIHIYHASFWYNLLYLFLNKYPIIQTIHDPTPHFGEQKLREKYNIFNRLRNAKRFVVLSHKMKEKLARTHNISNKKIDVVSIASPLRHCKLQKKKVSEIRNSVLFFGRVWKYKGLKYLIKSEPIISRVIPNLRIIIAGRGENMGNYLSMMENKDKFEIINRWIEDEELNEFFQKSSIVVMPYIEASQSDLPLLAYYFKKPIIATNVGGIPELIINGKSGILVPPRDEHSLAKAIILVLKNNSLRERLVKNGSDLLNDTFTWENTAKQAINCYNKCLIE